MIRGKQDVDDWRISSQHVVSSHQIPLSFAIVTGVIASSSVTVDDAQFTGLRILKDMMDQKVSECIFLVQNY